MSLDHLPMQIPGIPGIVKSLGTQELASLFKVKESSKNDELIALAVEEYNGAVYGMARAGVALLIVKTRVSRGDFLAALDKAGISSQRGSEMMRVAERLSELPGEEARKIAAMRPTVVIALTRFTAQELLWASHSGHIAQLAAMRSPEINEWRRQRRLGDADAEDPAPDIERDRERPRALEVATDELLAGPRRAQIELDRAKQVIQALLPPGHDDWKADRTELAHSVRLVLHAIIEQAQALDADLHTRFGVASVAPLKGDYRTLPFSRIRESGDLAEQQAELNTQQRAISRQKRLKWRGAPPKTLSAVIANARHYDDE